jgi:hypothetical protein
MTSVKVLSALLIAGSMLLGPAMAREHHLRTRHSVRDSYATSVTPNVASSEGLSCTRAPRVGAFASDPWTEPPCEPAIGYYRLP